MNYTNKKLQQYVTHILLAGGVLLLTGCTPSPSNPTTRVENVTENLYGVMITDPYRWLENKDAAETRNWIDVQNKYTESFLSQFQGRDHLRQRFTELFRIDQMGSPIVRNGRYFYSKKGPDQELTIYYYRNGSGGQEKVLIDPHGMSEDNRTSVSLLEISEDGDLFAYGIRQGGEDEVEIHWPS